MDESLKFISFVVNYCRNTLIDFYPYQQGHEKLNEDIYGMKYYSEDHEWVEIVGDEATVGISEYAVDELGDITYVELPEEEDDFIIGDRLGEVESVNSSSEIYSRDRFAGQRGAGRRTGPDQRIPRRQGLALPSDQFRQFRIGRHDERRRLSEISAQTPPLIVSSRFSMYEFAAPISGRLFLFSDSREVSLECGDSSPLSSRT